jgi:hypothetical protein
MLGVFRYAGVFMRQAKQPIPLAALFITVALLLIAYFIMVLGIDAMQMHADEELSYRNMAYDFPTSMFRLATRNNQAPLWWIQIWAWQRSAGLSEFAGRVNSILWSMLTLSVLYQLGRSFFGERRFGWFAIAILSVNAYFFIYSHEIRMYALGMLGAVLSTRFFHAWLQKRTWRLAIMYGLSAALLLYIHYYFVFVVLAQVIYFLFFHLLNWHLLKQAIGAAFVAFLAWLPWIFILYGQLRFIAFSENVGLNIPTLPTNAESILALAQLSSNGLLWLYIPLLLLGFVLLWRKAGYRIALFWLIVSPALVLLINRWATIYNIRYTSFFIPAIGLTVGAAIAALHYGEKTGEKSKRSWQSSRLAWTVLLLTASLSLYNLPNYFPVQIPYRHLFQELSPDVREGDVLFTKHTGEDGYLLDQMARYLSPELLANQVDTLEEAQTARRLWYLTDSLFDDGVKATFRELESIHRVWSVFGQCTSEWCYVAQLMVAPPMREATFFGETIGFLGADISSVNQNQLPVLLWWMVEEQPQADYSISLQLLYLDGSLASQVDRQIDPPEAEIGEIPTSQLQPNGNYIDWRVLDLSNLPNGDYRLQVVVYQWQDGQRLTLPDGSDAYFIENISLNR